MGFWKDLRANLLGKEPTASVSVPINDERLLEWLGVNTADKEAMSESTYFVCLKKLSEAMGKMPIHYFQALPDGGRIKAPMTSAARCLSIRPNDYMTPTTFWTTLELLCEHYGNAFAYIDRQVEMSTKYSGEVVTKGLYIMQPNCVQIWMDNAGYFGESGRIWYQYTDPVSSKVYFFDPADVMHFRTWYSKDGITGEPVRRILKDTIGTATAAQDVMHHQYKDGMTAAMVMQYTSDIDEKRITQLQEKFADKLTGPKAAGKVIPIPIGLQLQKLDTSFADAQFYELRKYSALQIAAAFGIQPVQINDFDKATTRNSEQQALAFLTDTLQYRLKMYEEEINAKMLTEREQLAGYYFKFNEKVILRSDSKTQMDMLSEAVQNGIYKPNEAREFLDFPKAEGGDVLMCNGNYIPITEIGNQYKKNATNKRNSTKKTEAE